MDQGGLSRAIGRARGDAHMAEWDAMLTIAPPPARRISGTANLQAKKAPVRLIASARFQSSRARVSTVPSATTVAATLTRTVESAEGIDGARTPASTLAALETSISTAIASPPGPMQSRATASAWARD